VELLVVIAIIGILVALLLPAVQSAREAARRSQCVNNIKQVGIAIHNYHDAHKRLPPGSPLVFADDPNLPGMTWVGLVLPYIEEGAVYDSFNRKQPMIYVSNRDAVRRVVPTLICPTDPESNQPVTKGHNLGGNHSNPDQSMNLWYPASMGPTSPDPCVFCPEPKNSPTDPDSFCCQGWNYGTKFPENNSVGMFGRHAKGFSFKKVGDGLSKTLMVGEALPSQCIYQCAHCPNFPISGTSIPLNTFETGLVFGTHVRACGFKSMHPGGANFAFGDGSVQFLQESIDYRLYNEIGTRAGSEVAAL
jgi:prepilin-type processing-associated H-X9-DG protein